MPKQTITVPEQAYRELLSGGDPVEIASRCEIGFPFEARDWMATVSGIQVMMEYISLTDIQRTRLGDLNLAINLMIQSQLKPKALI